MKNYLVPCVSVLLATSLSAGLTFAFEEEHEAHEHGHATLTIAQEGEELQLAFKSPAINIVGFEHQPSTVAQKAKVASAESLLKNADKILLINAEAKCSLEHAKVMSALLAEDAHNKHGKHHDEHHDKHAHDEHKHDDHEEHQDKHDHDEHAHHEHDKHHEDHADHEEAHSEFEAEYHFECANINALKSIDLKLFDEFKSLEELEAQIVTQSGQMLKELNHNDTIIKL